MVIAQLIKVVHKNDIAFLLFSPQITNRASKLQLVVGVDVALQYNYLPHARKVPVSVLVHYITNIFFFWIVFSFLFKRS